MSSVAVVENVGWKNGFAVPHTPGVFVHQMTGPTLRRGGIGLAVVQAMHPLHMRDGIYSTMNMTPLTVLGDNLVAFQRRHFTLQGFFKHIRATGSQEQQRHECAYEPGKTQCQPRHLLEIREGKRETGFEPATFSLGS